MIQTQTNNLEILNNGEFRGMAIANLGRMAASSEVQMLPVEA